MNTFIARIEFLKHELTPVQFNLLSVLAAHPDGIKSRELSNLTKVYNKVELINSKMKALLKSEELEIHVTFFVLENGSNSILWALRDTGVLS